MKDVPFDRCLPMEDAPTGAFLLRKSLHAPKVVGLYEPRVGPALEYHWEPVCLFVPPHLRELQNLLSLHLPTSTAAFAMEIEDLDDKLLSRCVEIDELLGARLLLYSWTAQETGEGRDAHRCREQAADWIGSLEDEEVMFLYQLGSREVLPSRVGTAIVALFAGRAGS